MKNKTVTPRLGLALSGGGFRATLFHLGLVRFLRDAELLPHVTHIASVSGGSILAAHLALNWDRYNGDDEEFQSVADEIVRFAQFDVRNRIVRRLPLQLPIRILEQRLLRSRNRQRSANELLERYYARHLFGDHCLHELPEHPDLHILATNVSEGNLVSFCRRGIYLQRRHRANESFDLVEARLASIPMAVAASSAFPGFFPPFEMTAGDMGIREGEFPNLVLTDGGVYDNLGVRAFRWLRDVRRSRQMELSRPDFHDWQAAWKALQAPEAHAGPLGWFLERLSLDTRRTLEEQERASSEAANRLLRELSDVLEYNRFQDEERLAGLCSSNSDVSRLLTSRAPDRYEQAWINRELMAQAFQEAVGKPNLRTFEGDFDNIIVSDVGQPFHVISDATLGFIAQSIRASDILWDRVWKLERENFERVRKFVFAPITDTVDPDENPGALPLVVQSAVRAIRTDLDRFSDLEIATLVRHGYEVARKVWTSRSDIDIGHLKHTPSWDPFTSRNAGKVSSTVGNVPSTAGTASEVGRENTAAGEQRDANSVTSDARALWRSARRRVWSSLFDFRDWTSYVYLPLLVFVFLVLPYQGWDFYQRSQRYATVVQAITQGDPDLRQLLEVVNSNPTDQWNSQAVETIPMATDIDYGGYQVTTHGRIIDLRNFRRSKAGTSAPALYLRDLYSLRRESAAEKQFVLHRYLPTPDMEFRCGPPEFDPVVRRVEETVEKFGEQRTLFEITWDLSSVSPGERAVLRIEMLGRHEDVDTQLERGRNRFTTEVPTDTVAIWLLFPHDRPYRSYNTVTYMEDSTEPPRMINTRYTVDHPYGNFIGWSIVNPEPDRVYECRWTFAD